MRCCVVDVPLNYDVYILNVCLVTICVLYLQLMLYGIVNMFKYLSILIDADGKCFKEVKCVIAQAKAAFHRLKNIQ